MRIGHYLAAAGVGVSLGFGIAGQGQDLEPKQGGDKLTAATLRNMIQGLGYEAKVLNATEGKEKYEVGMKSVNLNIPVGFEISPSGNYIWMTVFLGENKASKKHEELLKENGNVQPTFFYITSKGNLMSAQAIDNRGVTPAVLKRCLDKLVADVDKTAKTWQSE